MIDSKATLMVEVASSPEREEARNEYLAKAGPITASYGGKPEYTYKVLEPLGHNTSLQLTIMYSFPDKDAIHGLFSDPEYKAILPVREKAFSEIRYTIMEQVPA